MSERDRAVAKLRSHMPHHHIKKWLLDGAIAEDANTIRRAIRQIPSEVLIRRMIRLLTKDLDG